MADTRLGRLFVEIAAKAPELERVTARAQRDIAAVQRQAELLGQTTGFDAAAAKVKALERTITYLSRKAPEELDKVKSEIGQLVGELEQAQRGIATTKIMGNLSTEMDDINAKARLLGTGYNEAADRARALQNTIIAMSRSGVDPQSAEMLNLTTRYQSAANAAKEFEHQVQISGTLQQVDTGLSNVSAKARLLGDSYNAAAERSQMLQQAILQLTSCGLTPADSRIQSLTAQFREAEQASKEFEQALNIRKTMDALHSDLDEAKLKSKLLGKGYNEAADLAKSLERAIITLNNQGLSRNSIEMQRLVSQYRTATTEMKRFEAQSRLVARGQQLISSAYNRARMAVAAGIATIGATAVAGGKIGIEAYTSREQRDIAFTNLFNGSQEAGQQALNELWNIAKETPFDFNPIADLTQRLMAVDVDWKDIPRIITAIGDAAAKTGKGTEAVERISNALIQMRQKGKVSSEEMTQQLGELIPAWKMLADQMGVTTTQAQELAEKGLIPADWAFRALIRGMESWAPNAMSSQIDTLNTKWSGFTDSLKGERGLLSDIGKELIETFDVKKKLDDATQAVLDLQDALKVGGWQGLWNEVIPPWVEPTATLAAMAIAGKGALSLVGAIKAFNAALAAGSTAATMTAYFLPIVAGATVAYVALLPVVRELKTMTDEMDRLKNNPFDKFTTEAKAGASAFDAWKTGTIHPDSRVNMSPADFKRFENLPTNNLEKYREIFESPEQYEAFEKYMKGALGAGEAAAQAFAEAWKDSFKATAALSRNTTNKMSIDSHRATVVFTNQSVERWKALQKVYLDTIGVISDNPFQLKLGGEELEDFKLKPEFDFSTYKSGLEKWLDEMHNAGQAKLNDEPFKFKLSFVEAETEVNEFKLQLESQAVSIDIAADIGGLQTIQHEVEYTRSVVEQEPFRLKLSGTDTITNDFMAMANAIQIEAYRLQTGVSTQFSLIGKGMVEPILGAADELVFHSIVPDMVQQIIGWMNRLRNEAIPPARALAETIVKSAKEAEENGVSSYQAVSRVLSQQLATSLNVAKASIAGLRTSLVESLGPIGEIWLASEEYSSSLARVVELEIQCQQSTTAYSQAVLNAAKAQRALQQETYSAAETLVHWLDTLRTARGGALEMQNVLQALKQYGLDETSAAAKALIAEQNRLNSLWESSKGFIKQYTLDVLSGAEKRTAALYLEAAAVAASTGNWLMAAKAAAQAVAAIAAFETLKSGVNAIFGTDEISKETEVLKRLAEELKAIETLEAARGDAYDELTAKANAYRQALEELARAGASANVIKEITIKLQDVEAQIEARKNGVPKLATGGIIPAKPGGRLVLAGEGGEDEAIIPLNNLRNGMGPVWNGDIIINEPRFNDERDLDRMMDAMFSRMRRKGIRV